MWDFFFPCPDYPVNTVASFFNHQQAACNSGTRAINLRQKKKKLSCGLIPQHKLMPFSMRFYKLGRIFSTMKLITTVWRRNKKCHPELPPSLNAGTRRGTLIAPAGLCSKFRRLPRLTRRQIDLHDGLGGGRYVAGGSEAA